MIAFAKPDNLIDFPNPKAKSNEWFTPARYIEAAREVMNGIDLDPASCKEANKIVKATHYYTQRENGLEQPWYGKIWLNPPYNATHDCRFPQPTWARKLQREYQLGNVEQAMLLISAATKQKWFHELLEYPVCLMLERIFFIRPGKHPEELRHGNTVVYLGSHEQKFIDVFSKFGTIAKRVSPPKSQPVNLSLWETQT